MALAAAGGRVGLIFGLARGVPIWAWALAAVLAWGAWQRHSATRAADALAAHKLQTEAARSEAMHSALIETTRRLSAQQEVTRAAQSRASKALQDRAAAASAADGLRQYADQLAARAGACDSGAADGGAAARTSGLVLADMLGRLEARGRELAAALDAASTAGAACERSYDALTRQP
mgnify:CR=1 FL=1